MSIPSGAGIEPASPILEIGAQPLDHPLKKAAARPRTPDRLITNQQLYRLSYDSKNPVTSQFIDVIRPKVDNPWLYGGSGRIRTSTSRRLENYSLMVSPVTSRPKTKKAPAFGQGLRKNTIRAPDLVRVSRPISGRACREHGHNIPLFSVSIKASVTSPQRQAMNCLGENTNADFSHSRNEDKRFDLER